MKIAATRYCVTALPTLGELGSKPPIRLGELRAMMTDQRWAREAVDAVLLLDDLTQRESFLSGESADVSPSVLTTAQARNEAALPEALQAHHEETGKSADSLDVDRLWSSYFRHAAALARKLACPFLRDWVAFEVGLRNALAVARAQRLDLPAEDYRVATELDRSDEDFAGIVDEWTRAADPLTGWRGLIKARWHWVAQHDAWFTFDIDELAAYAVKLLLLHQAFRLAVSDERVPSRQAAGDDGREDGDR